MILAVDDDPQVLAAVRRDLRDRYGQPYRILGAGGGPEALELVHELQLRGDTIAAFLVDQRMPELTGTAFLLQAREHFPDAKRVLLTAYADTDAAVQSSNDVGLDHYLLEPWDPPEDSLYPVLDDRVAGHPDPVDGLRVVGPLRPGEPRRQGLPRPQPAALPLPRPRPGPGGAHARRQRRC